MVAPNRGLLPQSYTPRVHSAGMSVTTAAPHHVEAIEELLSEWAELGRTLTVEYGGLTVASGDTYTVSGTESYSEVENGGTIETAGTLVSGASEGDALHTIDAGEIDRYSTVSNAGTIENAGTLDTGVEPWSADPPVVRKYWDDAQSERGPGADQPAIAYVWSPTDSTKERFSMDGTRQRQNNTVEIQIWSLDASEAVTLQKDISFLLSKHLDDNTRDTPYSTVEPVAEKDFREQKPARQTDHFITAVEVETDGLTDTGLTE